MTILSINTISASEINDTKLDTQDNNQNSDEDKNEDTIIKDSSNLDENDYLIEDNAVKGSYSEEIHILNEDMNENEKTLPKKNNSINNNYVDKEPKNTIIKIQSNSIITGDNILISLKDNNGNPVINANLRILISNTIYNKVTDYEGTTSLKLDLPGNNYLMTVNYAGNTDYNPSKAEFNIQINKKESNIIIQTYSVVKGSDLIVQLVDKQGDVLKNKIIHFYVFNMDYHIVTDDTGFAHLNINSDIGYYPITIKFEGDDIYLGSENSFTMNIYKLQTNFKVTRIWIPRGTHFKAYLKDSNGNAITNALVKITFKNKKIIKKTDNNGKITLKINNKLGKYKINLIYGGDNSYSSVSKKIKIHVYRAKTKIITGESSVIKGKCLHIYLKDKSNRPISHRKLIIKFSKKTYKRKTNSDGLVLLKLNKALGTYKIKVSFKGSKGYIKTSRYIRATIIKDEDVIDDKALKLYLNGNTDVEYAMRFVDSNGQAIVNQTINIKTKCNDFTAGTGRKITKKTIVLASDNIYNKARDKKLLKAMAKLLRAKGYKVKIAGIGPNYHVKAVKKYSKACVFSLVGGIDSGMFVDMASSYYQKYLRKHKNQFVLGCVKSPHGVNLANAVWLKRAHDDDYTSPDFTGIYFPGKYLNKNTHVNYVYGATAKALVNNFLKYARHGKSIGMHNTIPGEYTTHEVITDENGYASINLHLGTHTIISSFYNPITNSMVDATEYVKVVL